VRVATTANPPQADQMPMGRKRYLDMDRLNENLPTEESKAA
jgi:hypothetical protein